MADTHQLKFLSRCPDLNCLALPGDVHDPECSLAVCLLTGEPRHLHAGGGDEMMRLVAGLAQRGFDNHDCGEDVWSGEQAGSADCRRLGWYVRIARGDDQELGWIPCEPDHADAHLDFYRLWTDARWCPSERRWIALETANGGHRE